MDAMIHNSEYREYADKLQPGMKADFVVVSGSRKGRYPTIIEECNESDVTILCPLVKTAPLPLYKDMEAVLVTEDSNALYEFEISVARMSRGSNIPCVVVDLTGDARRIQRRHFLRVDCSWDIDIFHIEQEMAAPMTVNWKKARAMDISLRGLRFRIPDIDADDLTFEPASKIMIRYDLFEKEYFVMGTTTRIQHTDGVWEVGLSFDTVGSSAEKKLFEFIREQEILSKDNR